MCSVSYQAMEVSIVTPSWSSFNTKHRPYTSKCKLKCYCWGSKNSNSNAGQQVKMTAIQRICEKLRSKGYMNDQVEVEVKLGAASAGEIFLPTPNQLVKHSVGHTLEMDSWSSWEKEKEREKKRRENVPTLAEMTLSAEELRRLRTAGIRTESKLRIGKAGISEGIIDSIHQRWKNSEVIKIKCHDLSASNMRRTHYLLEMKTGGIVVWRAGSIVILYKGKNYETPCVKSARSLGVALKSVGDMKHSVDRGSINTAVSTVDSTLAVDASNKDKLDTVNDNKITGSFVDSDIAFHEKNCILFPGKTEYEREIDSLLDCLGPRSTDWWRYDPSPVDADLLQAVVPGYKKPFRLLPYGMKPKLTDNEMTRLRRLARPLPPHFALGINEHLQGLAVAMVKLWERSEIAKIAVKQGVQNTDSEKMAEEIKRLTGGSLLSRDKEFIVFYRGKDFLPSSVAAVLEERKAIPKVLKEKDEIRLLETISPIPSKGEMAYSDSDTLSQFAKAREQWIHSEVQRKIKEEASRTKQITAARWLDIKLKTALEKEELADLEKTSNPAELSANKEMITEEERFMLCKLGLRMKPFLMLGRRGVFDGVVENMHLHWKYRDLVKIISKEKSVAQVNDTARMLEYESGGILVAVERLSKGHAIIVYRGKNYQRPTVLRPKNLLTKNAALKRSIDIQRHKSKGLHILQLERNIERLESHLSKVEDENEETNELMIEELDAIYPSEDDIAMESTENLDCAYASNDNVETTMHSTKERDSAYLQNTMSEDYVTYLDNCDTNNGKEDNLSKFETGKVAAKSEKTKTRTAEHNNIKNKIPEQMNRAQPLSNKQRLTLRKQALQKEKRAQFHVGKSNVLSGLAKSIRSYFEKHVLVIVGVKGRARGTSIQEIVFRLEEATGGVLVSQEPAKLILYRGWPEGEEKFPHYNEKKESKDISPELMKAIRKECGLNVEDHNSTWNDVKKPVHVDKGFFNLKITDEDRDLTLNSQE